LGKAYTYLRCMKFLLCPPFQEANAILHNFEHDELVIQAKVEVYSRKKTTEEKRLARQLDQRLAENKESEVFKPVIDRDTRKKIISLILAMNARFPDYDFSDLQIEDFKRIDPMAASQSINNLVLDGVDATHNGFRTAFWKALDQIMEGLKDCEVFSFDSVNDECLGDAKIWGVLYFWYSKKAKKMALFSASATSKYSLSDTESDEEDEDIDMEVPKPTGVVDVGMLDLEELGVRANPRTQWLAGSLVRGVSDPKQLTPVFSAHMHPVFHDTPKILSLSM